MDLKGFLADQMGHLTVYDLPLLLFNVLAAMALAIMGGRVAGAGVALRSMALLAGVTAFAVFLVKGSLPLAVALVAAVLLLLTRRGTEEEGDMAPRLFAVAVGFGFGASAGAITLVVAIPLAFVLRWTLKRSTR